MQFFKGLMERVCMGGLILLGLGVHALPPFILWRTTAAGSDTLDAAFVGAAFTFALAGLCSRLDTQGLRWPQIATRIGAAYFITLVVGYFVADIGNPTSIWLPAKIFVMVLTYLGLGRLFLSIPEQDGDGRDRGGRVVAGAHDLSYEDLRKEYGGASVERPEGEPSATGWRTALIAALLCVGVAGGLFLGVTRGRPSPESVSTRSAGTRSADTRSAGTEPLARGRTATYVFDGEDGGEGGTLRFTEDPGAGSGRFVLTQSDQVSTWTLEGAYRYRNGEVELAYEKASCPDMGLQARLEQALVGRTRTLQPTATMLYFTSDGKSQIFRLSGGERLFQ